MPFERFENENSVRNEDIAHLAKKNNNVHYSDDSSLSNRLSDFSFDSDSDSELSRIEEDDEEEQFDYSLDSDDDEYNSEFEQFSISGSTDEEVLTQKENNEILSMEKYQKKVDNQIVNNTINNVPSESSILRLRVDYFNS